MRQTLKYLLGATLLSSLLVSDFAKSEEINGTNQESNPIEIKVATESIEKAEVAKTTYNESLQNLEQLDKTLETLNNDNLVTEAIKLKKRKETEERAKQQAASAATVNTSSSGSVPMPDAHVNHVYKMANLYGVDPKIIFGIIKVESSFNPNAKSSSSSASGYGQFIRSTAEYIYEKKLNRGAYNHSMAFDPYLNIEMIAYYISSHYKTYGNYSKALIRYNGGELGQRYADKVLAFANSL